MGRWKVSIAVAVALVAGLSLVPAKAAGGLPNLIETSVDSGWTNRVDFVAARFDRALTADVSAVITDRHGDEVGGFSYRNKDDWRVITWEGDPFADCLLYPSKGPFTVTFTAPAYGDADPQTATHVLTFGVDQREPYAPSMATDPYLLDPSRRMVRGLGLPPVQRQAVMEATALVVVSQGEAVPISGEAIDPIGPPPAYLTDWTSGISKVELRLFNALEDRSTDVLDLRQVLDICPHSCAPSATFDTSVVLPQGVWVAKAVATDVAKNVSGASDDLTILVV